MRLMDVLKILEKKTKCIFPFLLQLQADDCEQIILHNTLWQKKTVSFS